MLGFGGHPGDPRRLLVENREELRAVDFRHLFAYRETSIGRSQGFVKCEL
jgi:hypothetical protein